MIPGPRVICVGGAHFDIKLKAIENFSWNDSNPVKKLVSPGGVARNIAENLARLGVSVGLSSRVGKDSPGETLIENLKNISIEVSQVTRSERHPTASYTAFLSMDGEMILAGADMEIYQEITPELLKPQLSFLQQAEWVIVDSNLTAQAVEFLAENLSGQTQILGVPVSNQKVKNFESALGRFNGMILNRNELSTLIGARIADPREVKQACLALLEKGCTWVIVTGGGNGVFVTQGSQFQALQVSKQIHLTDVTGAGDSFAAGVLFSLQKGVSLFDSVQWGIGCAQLTLQSEYSVCPDLSPDRLSSATQASAMKVLENQ